MEIIHSLLLQAIEGESSAEVGYKRFAEKALSQGFVGVASLFESLSRAEAIHIVNHRRALAKNGYSGAAQFVVDKVEVDDTLANIEKAIKAEYEEYKNMYPSFCKQIRKKYGGSFEAKIALLSMKWANESEEVHHTLLKQASAAVREGKDVTGGDYYLCSVCGNIHYLGSPPEEVCKVCGHDISFYSKVRVKQ